MASRLVTAALLALGCVCSSAATATSLEITPVAVHLVPQQKATTIKVMNRGGVAAAIQLRSYAWAQNGDEDVLTATRDIILSPPMFTVAPGASQTVRLLLRGEAPALRQRSYRLLLDEVPPANSGAQHVMIAMRVSLPLIIGAAAPKPSPLSWSAQRGSGTSVILTATNPGNVYDRVQAIAVIMPDGSRPKVATSAANAYVLPGARRHWLLDAGSRARELRLSVTTQAGKSEQVLALDP